MSVCLSLSLYQSISLSIYLSIWSRFSPISIQSYFSIFLNFWYYLSLSLSLSLSQSIYLIMLLSYLHPLISRNSLYFSLFLNIWYSPVCLCVYLYLCLSLCLSVCLSLFSFIHLGFSNLSSLLFVSRLGFSVFQVLSFSISLYSFSLTSPLYETLFSSFSTSLSSI